jgi:hypothetical protein
VRTVRLALSRRCQARTRIAAAAMLPRDCLGESEIVRCAERGDGKG